MQDTADMPHALVSECMYVRTYVVCGADAVPLLLLQDRLQDLNTQAHRFISQGHFDAEGIKAKKESLNTRYAM